MQNIKQVAKHIIDMNGGELIYNVNIRDNAIYATVLLNEYQCMTKSYTEENCLLIVAEVMEFTEHMIGDMEVTLAT